MSDSTQSPEADAIRHVVLTGKSMDYIDVVHAVHEQFRLTVTSALVEQVVHDLVSEKNKGLEPADNEPAGDAKDSGDKSSRVERGSRIGFELSAALPEEMGTEAKRAEAPSSASSPSPDSEDLVQALQFVKSVGGLANAQRVLKDLEAMLRDNG